MNRFRADLVLLSVALIWGSTFAVQRVAAQWMDPYVFNGLRFILGGVILLPFSPLSPLKKSYRAGKGNRPSSEVRTQAPIANKQSLFYIISAGVVLFAGSALQQVGLQYTSAGNAGFLNTLYVVLVPIFLVLFLREKISWVAWIGAGIAICGSLLLSTSGSLHLAPGDGLEMAAAVMWALDVILVSRVVQCMEILTFAVGHYLVAGLLNVLVGIWMPTPLAGLGEVVWTIIYIGVLSTAGGYTLQALGQKYAPPTDASILLSMEAVFAVLAGFIFLGETMLPIQLVGCGMILLAVIITQLSATRLKARVAPAEDITYKRDFDGREY
jgi:drug/metabolite transporter (DMT)-like permease